MRYFRLSIGTLLHLICDSSATADILHGVPNEHLLQKGENNDDGGLRRELEEDERKRVRPHKVSLSPHMSLPVSTSTAENASSKKSKSSKRGKSKTASDIPSHKPTTTPGPTPSVSTDTAAPTHIAPSGKAHKHAKSGKTPKSSKMGKTSKAAPPPPTSDMPTSIPTTIYPTPSPSTSAPTDFAEARIRMTIPSGLYLQDFAVDDNADDSDILMALSMTIKEVAEGGLSEGQSVKDVMIKSIEAASTGYDNNDDDEARSTRRLQHLEHEHMSSANEAKGIDNGLTGGAFDYGTDRKRRKLQIPPSLTEVQYDLVLDELCGTIRCEELADTTSMYRTVTSYMIEEVRNEGFDEILQENLEECGEACDDLVDATVVDITFEAGIVEVLTSMPTSAPASGTLMPAMSPTLEPTPYQSINPTSNPAFYPTSSSPVYTPTRLPTTIVPSPPQTPMPTVCPASDVPDATVIEVNTTISGTNVGGPAVPEGFCGISITDDSNVAWYRAVGTGNTLTASTCDDADFDTKIIVYCSCNEYSNHCIGGNDDTEDCSEFTSRFSWPSINGQEYLIMVFGFDRGTGKFNLTLSDDGIQANAPSGQCDAVSGVPTNSPTSWYPTYFPTGSPISSTLVPSPNCVPGYTCLQNGDFGEEDTTQYKMDFSLEMLDPTNADAYSSAREKWMEVITGDLDSIPLSDIVDDSDCANSPPAIIDDLHICGLDADIDGSGGILGQAGPLWWRVVRDDFDNLESIQTITGQMVFDIADIQTMIRDGIWENVIRHEMAHVFGVGTFWQFLVVDENLDYYGEQATRVWQDDWDCVGTPPVEKDFGPGTQGGHWDEACLMNELMTGFANAGSMPLSTLTIASIEDIGYSVNYDVADEYDGSDTTCCFGNIGDISESSKPTKPPLSESGLGKAIAYGQKLLSEKQRPSEIGQDDENNGLMYVGDRFINILIEENGYIYDVHVTRSME